MNAHFATSFDTCQHISFNRFVNPFTDMIEWMKPIFSPGTTSYKQHMQIINNFAYGIIKERRLRLAAGYEFQDMLSRFMTTEKPNGELLSDDELRDTLLTFWRLAEKLLKEIHQYLPNDTDDPRQLYEVIKKMTYAHAVFYEVLRLYPSVPTSIRLSLEEDRLPSGVHVCKGDSIMWSPYAAGRSSKIWGEDAQEFNPERWVTDDGNLQRVNQCVWPAFNAGPRVCLGQNLATLEALVVITYLLKHFKFTLVPDQEITYALSLTLQMRNGMKVHVANR
ncbi:cytochrome P450 [Fennellomyces sp. T-0311]|nr:cytochrome P450 [Fennellomyces sp. T-0311]